MPKELKYYGTNMCLGGEFLKALVKLSYKDNSHHQFRIVCKALNMAQANRICLGAGLGINVFESNYTSETNNDFEMQEADKHELIIALDGTMGQKFVGIGKLIETVREMEKHE